MNVQNYWSNGTGFSYTAGLLWYDDSSFNARPDDMNTLLTKILAPTGRLRASINLGNPILANLNPATGQPEGVSIDLAQEFARRMGLELDLVVFDAAGKSVDAVKNSNADIGFFAIDPLRGEEIAFTAAYVQIEGCFMVRENSTLIQNEDVDKPGIRVAVGARSAYDLYLSRELRHAQIVRLEGSNAVVDGFLAQGLEVAAGIKQPLLAAAKRHQGLRLLPGHFMVIQQAMGMGKARGQAAVDCLAAFVEDMKASGFVSNSLLRHGIQGAEVAPQAV
jgi:polar amino acid transport system substrate-binding protein